MTETEFTKIWATINRKEWAKTRECLINGCQQKAIKSHALQKNGILKEISEKNHLFQFSNVSPFEKHKKGNFEIKKIGINDVYTFPGFCKDHDNEIFTPIEKKDFDIMSNESINLFSYRAICQEIRRKEIVLDIAERLIETNYTISLVVNMSALKMGLINGLKNLNYFKQELENDFKMSLGKFSFKICEIPKTEICISAPLNIRDPYNYLSMSHDDYGSVLNNPFVTSIINIFPYHDKSYVMVALNNEFHCNWTKNLFTKFENIKAPDHLKLISDLITTRLEFWCLSPKLRYNLKTDNINTMFDIWSEEILNFESDLITEFNVFN